MKTLFLSFLLLVFACEERQPELPFNPPMAARRYITDLGYTVVGIACSTGECVVRVSEVPTPLQLDCPDVFGGRTCSLSKESEQKLEVSYPPSVTIGPNGPSLHLPM